MSQYDYDRAGFSQSSSRHEIGTGRTAPRPDLQRKRTVDGATPDWAMFGIKNPDGTVTVIASTELSFLNLRQDAGYFDELNYSLIKQGRISSTPWDIEGRMVRYIKITAPTYGEAIRDLFSRGWRPDGEPSTEDLQRQAALDDLVRSQLEPPPLAIEGEPEIVDAEIVEEGQ